MQAVLDGLCDYSHKPSYTNDKVMRIFFRKASDLGVFYFFDQKDAHNTSWILQSTEPF